MTSKIAQAERIAAEMQHTLSPQTIAGRAEWIVQRYRLQPSDLPDGRHVGEIYSVNTQGLDALTSLVYITGLSKPVALSQADVETLVRLSGSPFAGDWIGLKVAVCVVEESGPSGERMQTVRLLAPGAQAVRFGHSSPAEPGKPSVWLMVGVAVLVALLAFSVLSMEQRIPWEALLEQATSWLGG